MANLPWFKFYGSDYISDQKILELSAAERSCWITLLAYASQDNGYVKHLSEHKLMTQAGVDFMKDEWKETEGVLKHFKKLGMIRLDNGVITIVNWGKRQERAMTAYERLKKHRAKITDDNAEITPRNANDNPRVDKSREDKNNSVRGEAQEWNFKFFQLIKSFEDGNNENIKITPRERLMYPKRFREKYSLDDILAALAWAVVLHNKKGDYYWRGRITLPNLLYKILPAYLEEKERSAGKKKLEEMKAGVMKSF